MSFDFVLPKYYHSVTSVFNLHFIVFKSYLYCCMSLIKNLCFIYMLAFSNCWLGLMSFNFIFFVFVFVYLLML